MNTRRGASIVPSGLPSENSPQAGSSSASASLKKSKLFDTAIFGNPQVAMDFIANILESSTEYSIIAKDLTGKILLWNEGARRLYGYEPMKWSAS